MPRVAPARGIGRHGQAAGSFGAVFPLAGAVLQLCNTACAVQLIRRNVLVIESSVPPPVSNCNV